MSVLKDLAIKAFNEGKDNYGEVVIGASDELTYNSSLKGYSKTVFLKDMSDNPCTSGVGFYINSENKLSVVSGIEVFVVDLTPEINEELNNAVKVDY